MSYNNQKSLHCARCCRHKASLGASWVDAGREPALDTIEAQGFAREEASSEFGHKAVKRQPSGSGIHERGGPRASWVDVVEAALDSIVEQGFTREEASSEMEKKYDGSGERGMIFGVGKQASRSDKHLQNRGV